MKSALRSFLVSVTNWYNLADDGDEGTLVEYRWTEAEGRGRRSCLCAVDSQRVRYLRTEHCCLSEISSFIVSTAIVLALTARISYEKGLWDKFFLTLRC
jgi:hypothetical protein